MSCLKDFIKGNRVLYSCAKFVFSRVIRRSPKPLDKKDWIRRYKILEVWGLKRIWEVNKS